MKKSPQHVLVIDNDIDVLRSVKYNLEVSGFKVTVAQTPEEARYHLDNDIIHLAVIDVRLKHEDLPGDISGFDIARELPNYIPCIIFTAYEDTSSIRTALGELKAKDIINKSREKAAQKLVEKVHEIFATSIKTNFLLHINGAVSLSELALSVRVSEEMRVSPTPEDVQQILQTLFHDAVSISLARLLRLELLPTSTQSGSALVEVRPQYESAWGTRIIVKLSDRNEIANESLNYKKIKPFLGGNRLAVYEGEAYSRDVGGIVYRLIDTKLDEQISTFGELYESSETDTIIQLLDVFFKETFSDLYTDARRQTLNLTEIYTEALHLTPEKLFDAIEQFHPKALSDLQLRFDGLVGTYWNPILWVLPGNAFRVFRREARKKCLCHGDLHSRNILVDSSLRFWLIDFARAAESHALRDFAELETDIKFNLLQVFDLRQLVSFEEVLLISTNFDSSDDKVLFDDENIQRAYEVVLALRRSARRLLNLTGDMEGYYIALLFHTLNVLRLKHITTLKKEHALLAASLLAQRLDEWPRWSPKHLPSQATNPKTQAILVPSPVPPPKEKGRSLPVNTATILMTCVVVILILTLSISQVTTSQSVFVVVFAIVIVISVLAFAGLVSGKATLAALNQIIRDVLNVFHKRP